MKSRRVICVLAVCHGYLAAATQAANAEVVSAIVQVPMRDGVKLATDVYRDDAVKQAPVVLIRTPYDRTKQAASVERKLIGSVTVHGLLNW